MGRRRSRVSCKDCGAPVLFRSRGPTANPRLHSDKQHDLCEACWQRACEEGERAAAKLPPFRANGAG